MKDKKVSVIVPIYNVEKYLRDCISSVIEQTYENLEILLVNDGSKDNSLEICKEFQKKDNRIKIIDKPNGGLSDARNVGIENSNGEYLLFLDGDDFIANDMIDFLVNMLEENNADISSCGFINYVSEDKQSERDENVNEEYLLIMNREEAIEKMLDTKVSFGWRACNKLYKRELFYNVRYPFAKIYEDVGTTYKLIYNAQKIVYSSIPKYYYVHNPKSITKTYIFDDKEKNRIEMAEQMCLEISLKTKNKKILNKLDFFKCTQYISVVNVMIRSNTYDFNVIKNVRKLLRKNILKIIKYGDKKNIQQCFALIFSFHLYRFLFTMKIK